MKTIGEAATPMIQEELDRQAKREQFVKERHAKAFEKMKKVLKTIGREDATERLVRWFEVNRCKMSPEEFKKILEAK